MLHTQAGRSWRQAIYAGVLFSLLLALNAQGRPQVDQGASVDSAGANRFERTVAALSFSDHAQRARFATIALAELAEVYVAEADLARREAADAAPDRRFGWAHAVDAYSQQFLLLIEDLDMGFPVELSASPHEAVAVAVGGRSIILSHPRSNQQAALESRILARFCAGTKCEELTRSSASVASAPVNGGDIRWRFSEDGAICSSGTGLEVVFPVRGSLANYRRLCAQLVQEARSLVQDIRWQSKHGVVVEWPALAISTTGLRPSHLVTLNTAGDTSLVDAPLLFASGAALIDLTPWLASRVRGSAPVQLSVSASDYGWAAPVNTP